MYDKDKIKQSLTIEQIFDFLNELGAEPKEPNNNIIISKTVCHNPVGEGSYKLYYYHNTRLFKCYTECEEDGGFDIFDLVSKIKKIERNDDWSLYKSVVFVASYFGFIDYDYNFGETENNKKDIYWSKLQSYKKNEEIGNKKIIDLKIYDENILKYLPQFRIYPWEKEGISWEIIKDRNIKYDPVNESIIIPHYDINKRLIGIRQRTLVKENEKYGKYSPAMLNGTMYNHPLSFNLYNINNSKDNIKLIKKAIIFESEKATMQYASYFGKENDISVAICGSSLIFYQVQLLLSLGVEELIIGLDKQFKEIGDEEFTKWTKKLQFIYNKYYKYCKITFLFDKWDLLDYKDSPVDKGDLIFLELFKRRIFL